MMLRQTGCEINPLLLRRAADWKLQKVDWDQSPDPLLGLDKWSHPTLLSSADLHGFNAFPSAN